MRKRFPVVAASAVAVAVLVISATAVVAWPEPDATASGAVCEGGVRATPATFTVTNKETGNPGSPGHVGQASIVASPALALPQPVFSPASLPNTGSSSASVSYDVPTDYAGTLTLRYRMFWDGTDGSDVRPALSEDTAQVSLTVVKCEAPETTTTSTTSTSTTTSTTAPTTSTTSTTVPETTTSTVPESTTTTTVRGETTTTTAEVCAPPAERQPSGGCLIPPVVIERTPEAAAPVPATPKFTG